MRTSLQARLLLLVGIGTVVVLGVFGGMGALAVRDNVQQTLQARLTLAQAIAQHLDYVLSQNLAALQDVAFTQQLDPQSTDLETERRALHDAYLHTILTDGVYLVDKQGNVVVGEPRPPLPVGDSLLSYPHVRSALQSGKPVISNLYQIKGSNRPVVSMVIPLKNMDGQLVGLIGGDADLTDERLQQIIAPVGLGTSGYVDLVDANGVVLASTRLDQLLRESDHSHRLSDLIAEKRSVAGTCHDCHETAQEPQRAAEVMGFAPLTVAPWGVMVRQSEEEALASAFRLRDEFLLFGVPLFLLALVLARGIAQSIVKPIALLTRSAVTIAAGDLEQAIPALGEDEIGRLASSLETMRHTLKESVESIRRWNRRLEARVSQRTLELEESRAELLQRNHDLSVLYQEIQARDALRGGLFRKVILAQEEERRRIARELHDSTSQSLAALGLALETIMVAPAEGADQVKAKLSDVKASSVEILEGVHKLIFDLRPSLLDDLGLLAALQWYAESRLQSLGIRVLLETRGLEQRLPPHIETALYRVVQEALNNVARHAEAQNVDITIDFGPDRVVVEVADDGVGFDLHEVSPQDSGRGLGLLGMQERIALLNGELEIQSHPGEGTYIRANVPIPGEVSHHEQDTRAHRR